MNCGIEMHDSSVDVVTPSAGSVVVRFRPAYVHRSAGRPGFDPGSVRLQDLDLVFAEAVLESGFAGSARQLDGGSLSIDAEGFENVIPFPLDVRGAVRFSAVALDGERLVIRATRATAIATGEASYLDRFSGIE